MPVTRPFPWLSLTGLLLVTAAALGGLLFGLSGDHRGRQSVAEATGSRLHVLDGSGAGLTFAEVSARGEQSWRPRDLATPVTAPAGETVWLRLWLRNPTAQEQRGVLENSVHFLDRVDAWLENGLGEWQHERSGEWAEAPEKSVWGRGTAFAVEVPAKGERVLFLRLEDQAGVWWRANWWPAQRDFFAAQVRDLVAESCYLGILLALLFYNAVLWVRVRFPATGFYLLYLGTFILFALVARSNLALIGVALGSPWMEGVGAAAMMVSAAALAEFSRRTLELARRAPRADRWVRGLAIALGVMSAIAVVVPAAGWTKLFVYFALASAVTHLVMLGVAITAWRAGSWQARYLVLAFGCLITGLLPAAAVWMPAVSLEAAGRLAMTGSALEMLLLSLAMSERFARTEREKLAAQQNAVAEAERRSQIQESYADELEHEVRERTRELAAANADKDRMMAVLGHDLRSPLTAITGMAEMLTRDASASAEAKSSFVAEAGHLGRQVLLLIEDLVLWARLRAGTTQRAEHSLTALLTPAVELHRAAAERRGVCLGVAELAAELRVNTDLVLAQTLVRNLVSNALRYARTRVLIEASASVGGVRLTVTDDGPGLPATVAARLVAEESQADWEGQGLGLRLCAEISRALGAGLRAEPVADGGTVFEFVLEAAKDASVSRK